MRSLLLTSLLILSQAGAAQNATGNVDAQMFRSIFSTLVDPKDNDTNRVNHLIYAPIPELLSASDEKFISWGLPGEQVARKALAKMQRAYAASNATAFYQQGLAAGGQEVDVEALTQNLKNQDMLIVVVPGIFGEFIKGRAFEEVFENPSAYSREFQAALEAQTQAQIGSKDNCESAVRQAGQTISVCDSQEQLSRLTLADNSGAKSVHMGELMNVGSIDDENGAPTTKVVLFQMDGMTLESLGRQQDRAAIFIRRLEKFFSIMRHTPKNIVFVGYSRGTDFALEMLAQASSKNKQWLGNVRGLVSLGGVVFGSALADDVFNNQKNTANCQLKLEKLLDEVLEELPALDKNRWDEVNRGKYLRNMAGWYRFLIANGKVTSKDFADGKITCEQIADLKSTKKLDKEEIKFALKAVIQAAKNQNGSDPDFGRKMVMSQAVKFGLVSDVSALTLPALLETAKRLGACLAEEGLGKCLEEFLPDVAKYNTDIRRFRKLIEAARHGVEELTTDSRLAWWSHHTIPTKNIRYYSVSGTMADTHTDLGNNLFGLNPRSPDDRGLVENWKNFAKVAISGEYAGVNLNDSQVAIYKTVFWPNVIASLNSANAGVKFTPLAVVGTHHWGMALPIVTEVRAKPGLLERNPFPRAELMQAIALSVAQDIKVDSAKAGRGE